MASFRTGSVVVLLPLVLAGLVEAQPQAPEHEVRAAFVFNFTRFIDWPAASFGPDAFRICVVGDDRFAGSLRAMVAGDTLRGLPIVVEDPQVPGDVPGCQILYIGRHQAARGQRALAAATPLPILTIGDSPGFLASGGAVRFLIENDRVRFDVNLPAVERAGLTMRSTVLRVARHVEKSG